jgi:hypothetical protein
MLDETAEQARVRLSHYESGIENDEGFGHGLSCRACKHGWFSL